MTGDHEKKADDLEREADDMQERTGKLGDDIEGAEEDWERKKGDPAVPGAPEPTGEESEDGDDLAADELDFGRDVDKDDIVAEDGPPADDDESDADDTDDDSAERDDSDDSDED